jgi:uncharacterized protein (TIGR01619 family)
MFKNLFFLFITGILFGCLDKTAEKKEIDNSSSEKKDSLSAADNYEEEWDAYITTVDDNPASILVDLGLNSIAPITDKFNFIWITLKMKKPLTIGLFSNEEKPMLDKIDSVIYSTLTTKLNAINAGRLTTDGYMHFYFYVGDTLKYNQIMLESLAPFQEYEFDFGAYFDGDWNTYFDLLYPDPYEYQEILNRRLVNTLIENGDKPEVSREVNHWIYFRTEQARANFINEAKKEGFIEEMKDYDKSEMEYPFSLMIKRVDKVDLESVNEYVRFLRELALKFGGDYDGWETAPVSSDL